jgi:hypothetical protein
VSEFISQRIRTQKGKGGMSLREYDPLSHGGVASFEPFSIKRFARRIVPEKILFENSRTAYQELTRLAECAVTNLDTPLHLHFYVRSSAGLVLKPLRPVFRPH